MSGTVSAGYTACGAANGFRAYRRSEVRRRRDGA